MRPSYEDGLEYGRRVIATAFILEDFVGRGSHIWILKVINRYSRYLRNVSHEYAFYLNIYIFCKETI